MKRIIVLTLISILTITSPVYAVTKPAKKVVTVKKRKIDEYKINPRSKKKGSVKVTDTDDLHIYSNTYQKPKNYTKFSYDEFNIRGEETPANDTYDTRSFDELHIPKQYQDNVWQPEEPVNRMGIDEFRLPNEME